MDRLEPLEIDTATLTARVVGAGKVVAFAVAATAVFAALGLWSLLDRATAIEPEPDAAAGSTSSDEPAPAPPAPTRAHGSPQGPLARPRDVSRMLDELLLQTGPEGQPSYTTLRSALAGAPGITVLNVWAHYCEPCTRELSDFRALAADWGEDVRFVALQLGDTPAPELAARMPAGAIRLIDISPGVVQAALRRLEIFTADAPIPITLLLDCRQRLRWVHVEAIPDMRALSAELSRLRDELDTTACRTTTARPRRPSIRARGPTCKGGPCPDAPDECACAPNETCRRRPSDGRGICVPLSTK